MTQEELGKMVTAVGAIAELTAIYHKELRKNGVDEATALILSTEFQKSIMRGNIT